MAGLHLPDFLLTKTKLYRNIIFGSGWVRRACFYLENVLFTCTTASFETTAFEAISSFWAFVLEAKVRIIITNTGTNSNKNGDTFVNFFIIVYFVPALWLMILIFCFCLMKQRE